MPSHVPPSSLSCSGAAAILILFPVVVNIALILFPAHCKVGKATRATKRSIKMISIIDKPDWSEVFVVLGTML